MEERQVKEGNDKENMKKSKLKSEKIRKIRKKRNMNSDIYGYYGRKKS